MVDVVRVETNRHEAFIVDRDGVPSQTFGWVVQKTAVLKAGRYKCDDRIRVAVPAYLSGRSLDRPAKGANNHCVAGLPVFRGNFSGQFAVYHA